MNADSVFVQGSGHPVCQDYANCDNDGLALVADGCSSAPDSDIAARLAWLAVRRSWQGMSAGLGGDIVAGGAADPQQVLAADLACLDAGRLGTELYATSLSARVMVGRLLVAAIGDGGILVRWKDGQAKWYGLGYPAWNAPLYWQYLLDPAAAARWDERFPGNGLKISTAELGMGPPGPGLASNQALPAGGASPAREAIHGAPAAPSWFWLDLDPAAVDFVLLLSDGIESFVDGQGQSVPALDILPGLMDFPNRSGEFLKRRLRRHLADLARREIGHRDDLSAAILVPG